MVKQYNSKGYDFFVKNKLEIILLIISLFVLLNFIFYTQTLKILTEDLKKICNDLDSLQNIQKEIDSIHITILSILPESNYRNIDIFQLHKLSKSIYINSKKYDIDPHLIISLIYVESKFNKYAKSSKNCIGYCQININIHDIDESKIYDENYNVHMGVKILKGYIELYENKNNNIKKALASYNAGPSGLRKGLGTNYVNKVLEIYSKLGENKKC